MVATFYCLKSPPNMADGNPVHHGAIAVYPPQIKLGTVGIIDGHHVKAEDTGSDITWGRIDIWEPNCHQAILDGVEKKLLYV